MVGRIEILIWRLLLAGGFGFVVWVVLQEYGWRHGLILLFSGAAPIVILLYLNRYMPRGDNSGWWWWW